MKKKPLLIAVTSIAVLAFVALTAWEFHTLQVAHSTFENYYNFRGCVQLVDKTDTYGTCKLASGETIKLVLIDGKWYLDGDGPGVW